MTINNSIADAFSITNYFSDIHYAMEIALEEAEIAYRQGDVPVGAVLLDSSRKLISRTHNEKEKTGDPTAHAEMLALKEAGRRGEEWRLTDHILVTTLEPCPMCLSAMIHSRIGHLIFGTYDAKGGAISLGYAYYQDKRFNHTFKVTGGILHYKNASLLSQFFRERRRLI